MSTNTALAEERSEEKPWKADWPVVAYIVAAVVDDRVEYIELPAMDDEFPMTPNRDLVKYLNHLAVSIQKSTHKPIRYHRFSLGTILQTGKFVPSFAPRVEGYKQGQPKVDAGYWTTLHGLMDRGETWQEKDATFQSDGLMARDTPRTPRKFVQRPGKTEQDREKGKARPRTE